MYRVCSMSDLEQYRAGYPGKKSDPSMQDNLLFYANKLRSRPDGLLIEEMLSDWRGLYGTLEMKHGYIQWLFPIREQGMNWEAEELQPHEAERIAGDEVMRGRALRSLALILDFFGFELDVDTLQTRRLANWQGRYYNLNTSPHNYLRITRILKFLGEVGLERLKMPLLQHFAKEVFETGALANCEESLCEYWVGTIRDDGARGAFTAKLRELRSCRKLTRKQKRRAAASAAAAAAFDASDSDSECVTYHVQPSKRQRKKALKQGSKRGRAAAAAAAAPGARKPRVQLTLPEPVAVHADPAAGVESEDASYIDVDAI